MTQCVLLNADYTFLNVVDWKRAMCLLTKDKITVLKYSERIVKTAEGVIMRIPAVCEAMVRLVLTDHILRARALTPNLWS